MLVDRVLMGRGEKKIDEYILMEELYRQKKLCVGFNKETGEKLYRPAIKLSKWARVGLKLTTSGLYVYLE